ncbi:putative PEP-binding protein [Streptomyces luteolifulvus]|nr:putative PEP-binding protein [Streptomyces luteolifulvus]
MSPTPTTMTGYGVSPGLPCAPLARMTPPVIPDPEQAPGENPAHEVQRIRPALAEVTAQLSTLADGGRASADACGDVAADPLLAPVLAGLGASSLSMAAPAVAAVRGALARLTSEQCKNLAASALYAREPDAARATAQRMSRTFLPAGSEQREV